MDTEIKFRFPDKPRRASLSVVRSLSMDEWVAQPKYDGWRLVVVFRGGKFFCFSRIGTKAIPIFDGGRFPFCPQTIEELRILAQIVPDDTYFDGELVGRRGSAEDGIFWFDILRLSGQWLGMRSFWDRWSVFGSLNLPELKTIKMAEIIENDFIEHYNRLYQHWISSGGGIDLFEGLVFKKKYGTKLHLNFSRNVKNSDMIAVKYREGADDRF